MFLSFFGGLFGAGFLSNLNFRSVGNVRVSKSGTRTLYSGIKLLGSYIESPLKGALYITSPFGARNTGIKGASTCHRGVDLRAHYVPVYSVLGGTVSAVANQPKGAGLYIKVNHGGSVETCYFHLSKQNVRVGQKVYASQQIGVSGNTGRTTGPHLHFVIRKDGQTIDPAVYLGLKK